MTPTPTHHCKLCGNSIRKLLGQESTPDSLACWIHLEGHYQCPGSRSEFDLATFDREEAERAEEAARVKAAQALRYVVDYEI
jgi:hypothetical protein